MDERGTVIRSRSADDPAISASHLCPYSVLPIPAIDRAVLTTTDMDNGYNEATSQWMRFWRLSDRSLLKSVALPPGPRNALAPDWIAGDTVGVSACSMAEPRIVPAVIAVTSDGPSALTSPPDCGSSTAAATAQLNDITRTPSQIPNPKKT